MHVMCSKAGRERTHCAGYSALYLKGGFLSECSGFGLPEVLELALA